MCTCISCRATVVSLEDFEVRLNQVNWNAPEKKMMVLNKWHSKKNLSINFNIYF